MAKTTRAKKTKAVPEVNVGKEIFERHRELEKLKGIPVEYMVDRLKQALTNAYRKDREDPRDIPAETVVVGISEEGLSMHQIKSVVEELEDIALEIHIDTARRYSPTSRSATPSPSLLISPSSAASPPRPPSRWSSRASARLSAAPCTRAIPPRLRSC